MQSEMQRIKIKWRKCIHNWFSVFMTGQETFNSLTRRHVFRDRLTPRHHSKCDSKYKSQLTFQIPKSTRFSDIKRRTVKKTGKQTSRNMKIMQSNPPKVYGLLDATTTDQRHCVLLFSPYVLFCTSDFTEIMEIVSGCDSTNRYSSLFVTLTHSQKSNLFK
jgi:hypothetical protein